MRQHNHTVNLIQKHTGATFNANQTTSALDLANNLQFSLFQ